MLLWVSKVPIAVNILALLGVIDAHVHLLDRVNIDLVRFESRQGAVAVEDLIFPWSVG